MRDPKQKKEALSQFGIKEEELGQAITETGKMKEMTEYRTNAKGKKAQDAMKLAQMKLQAARAKQAKASGPERMYYNDMNIRKSQGKQAIPYNKWKEGAKMYSDLRYDGKTHNEAQEAVEEFYSGETKNPLDTSSVEVKGGKQSYSNLWK